MFVQSNQPKILSVNKFKMNASKQRQGQDGPTSEVCCAESECVLLVEKVIDVRKPGI